MAEKRILETINDFASLVVGASGGRIKLVCNEEDDSYKTNKEAANFLKFDGVRLGRDLELYGFMDEIMGTQSMLTYIFEEVYMPIQEILKNSSNSNDVVEFLKDWGLRVYPKKLHDEWIGLFDKEKEAGNG